MQLNDFVDYYFFAPEGWLTFEEAALLVGTALKTQGRIVEIGSYKGRSSQLLGRLGREVICIDSWQDYEGERGDDIYAIFLQSTRRLPITAVKTRVEEWTPVEAEFVFLDGDHSYEGTKVQIEKAKACKPKFIAMHDINNERYSEGVRKASTELLGRYTSKLGSLGVWQI